MNELESMIAACPHLPERSNWIVGVSGGADSVALLRATRAARPDLRLAVAHLNHQTRGTENDADTAVVKRLCETLDVLCFFETRSNLETVAGELPRNRSDRFRKLRQFFFRRIVAEQSASGVLLAHHADDQAETVLLRLFRGGELASLAGIRIRSNVAGLVIVRPMLQVRRAQVESYLRSIAQRWRDDPSNRSPRYARNRVRMFLNERPDLTEILLTIARAASTWNATIRDHLPQPVEDPSTDSIADLPSPVARAALRDWIGRLADSKVSRDCAAHILEMCRDAATTPALTLPNGRRVRRRKGKLSIE